MSYSYDDIYTLHAWRDNRRRLILTQGEGYSGILSGDYMVKAPHFQLNDERGAIEIPSDTAVSMAITLPNGTEDLIACYPVDKPNGIFCCPIRTTMTSQVGTVKGEVRLTTASNTVIKFYGIDFCVYDGVSNSVTEQSPEFSALVEALSKVEAVTANGSTNITLDSKIQKNGLHPVTSGTIYDYLQDKLDDYGITDGEKISNKVSKVDFSTASERQYPSVAGLKHYHDTYVAGLPYDIENLSIDKADKSFFSKYSFLYDAYGNIFSYTWDTTITSKSFGNQEYTNDIGYYVWLARSVTNIEDGAFPNLNNIIAIHCENTKDNITIPQTYSTIKTMYGYSSLSMFYILASISHMFHGKADKSTTLKGYGITDAYTKDESMKFFNFGVTIGFDENFIPVVLLRGSTVSPSTFSNSNSEKIKYVFVDSGIKLIRAGAFVNCPNMTDLYISNDSDNVLIEGGVWKGGSTHYCGISQAYEFILRTLQYLNSQTELRESLKNKVSVNEEISSTTNSYPSIEYLHNYYYDFNESYSAEEVDNALDSKADKSTTLAGYGITDGEKSSNKVSTIDFQAASEIDYPSIAGLYNYHLNYVEDLYGEIDDKANKSTSLEGYGIENAYTKNEVDTVLGSKADKATTLDGYGITDAYTKDQISKYLNNKQDKRGWDTVPAQNSPNFMSSGSIYNALYTKADIEKGTISNFVATYDSNSRMNGSYTLIGDLCFVIATATIKGGWADIDYPLPVAATNNSACLATDGVKSYRVSTDKNNAHLYIHRVEVGEYQAEGTISFTLIYKYK